MELFDRVALLKDMPEQALKKGDGRHLSITLRIPPMASGPAFWKSSML